MRRHCVPRFILSAALLLGSTLSLMPSMAVGAVADARPAVCVANTGQLPVQEAQLLAVGNYIGPKASQSAQAQRFFNQGLVFGWGFNFAEAVRSFRAAAQLDPACALCRWGIAWALGPSINHDMQAADVPVALDAIVQARSHAASGSRERALIDALAARYSDRPGADTERLARGYATAMRALVNRYPADADVAVLAAEAMMNAHAYDYWKQDGGPKAWTPEIIAWLERALQLAPAHPGAHHYKIHLFEDSRQPERALASAQQLGTLAPIVGHLVHMPSHIFFRLGRYRDAVIANSAAVRADREYAASAGVGSDAIHNLHFLWASALWASDRDTALLAADELAAAAKAVPANDARDVTHQHFLAAPLLTRVRLGQWDATAAAGSTSESGTQPYLGGLTQYAKGMAHAAHGELAAAQAELASLQRSTTVARKAKLTVKNIHRASDILAVPRSLLASAVATASGMNTEALRHARAAVAAEDRLASDDPPVWLVPARHALAAALLRAGRATDAANAYRADLQRYPKNCTALKGLAAAEHKLPSSRVSFSPPAQASAHFAHCPE